MLEQKKGLISNSVVLILTIHTVTQLANTYLIIILSQNKIKIGITKYLALKVHFQL